MEVYHPDLQYLHKLQDRVDHRHVLDDPDFFADGQFFPDNGRRWGQYHGDAGRHLQYRDGSDRIYVLPESGKELWKGNPVWGRALAV